MHFFFTKKTNTVFLFKSFPHAASLSTSKSDGFRPERPRRSRRPRRSTPSRRRPHASPSDAGPAVRAVVDLFDLFHVLVAATPPALSRGQRPQSPSAPPSPLLPSAPADPSQGPLDQGRPGSTHGIPEHPRIHFALDFSSQNCFSNFQNFFFFASMLSTATNTFQRFNI